jgi:hypothetical protein
VLKLDLGEVRWNTVAKQLSQTKQSSRAFDHLTGLRNDRASWLSLLIELRNHGGHRQHIGRLVSFSTSSRTDNQFTDPRSKELQQVYPGLECMEVIKRLTDEVEALINDCRTRDTQL